MKTAWARDARARIARVLGIALFEEATDPMTSERQRVSALFLMVALAIFTLMPAAEAQTGEYQGFGATTPGGAGQPIVRVTNLDDSGPGSLREAVSQGNRTIVFDVGGVIQLTELLYVRGAFVTIDGFTAPDPGITLRNSSLVIAGDHGAHDVIVRGLRVRDSANDGIMIKYAAYNVVIDHVSLTDSFDGNIDVTRDAHDVTVSWSILAGNGKNVLIKYNPSRITFHHNLFVSGITRNPLISMEDVPVLATDTTVDLRNNVIWGWGTGTGSGFGTWVEHGARANIVNNFYKAHGGNAGFSAVVDTLARAHTSGNVSADGLNLNLVGNQATPYPAPAVDTQSACAAAQLVVANAGMRSPLDSIDAQFLAGVSIPFCQSPSASLVVSPSSLAFEASTGGPAPAVPAAGCRRAGGRQPRMDCHRLDDERGAVARGVPGWGNGPVDPNRFYRPGRTSGGRVQWDRRRHRAGSDQLTPVRPGDPRGRSGSVG